MNRILLVDDDYITNFINLNLLKKMNLAEAIKVCVYATDAMDYLKSQSELNLEGPELILLDINMPRIDGFDFMVELETLPFPNKEKMSVIILTTSTDHRDIHRISEYNIKGILQKPLSGEQLLNLISPTKIH